MPDPFQQFLEALISVLIVSLPVGFIARRLARDKGRNVTKWTIYGFIPFINFILVWYFVGASNLRMERKLDALLQAQGKDPALIV